LNEKIYQQHIEQADKEKSNLPHASDEAKEGSRKKE
jgi:hypothetical protein